MNVPDAPPVTIGLPAEPGPTRRRVLAGAGLVVAAGVVTAACGSSSDPAAAPEASSADGGEASSGGGSGGGASIDSADVPVGGGVILTGELTVVTQPTPGEFRAFSAVCTHKGCTVASIADSQIACPCHGSTFSIADGSVTRGPAAAPLAEVPVTVSGTSLTLG